MSKVYRTAGDDYEVNEKFHNYINPIEFAYSCDRNNKSNKAKKAKKETYIITNDELELGFAGELGYTLANESDSDYDILLNKLDCKSELHSIINDLTAWRDIILVQDGVDIVVLMKIGKTMNKKAINKIKGLIKKYHNGPKYFGSTSFPNEPKCGIDEVIINFLERSKDINKYYSTFN